MALLHFPQWQGSGQHRQLVQASFHLRQHLITQMAFTPQRLIEVPLVSVGDKIIEHNIAYRAALLQQLHTAQSLVTNAHPATLLTIGGDCGIETVPIAYANAQAEGEMALVWLDAHGDLNTPASSPSKHYHGMVLRTLCGVGDAEITACVPRPLTPKQIFLVGVRDLDAPEQAFIEAQGISHTPTLEIEALMQAIRAQGYTQVYIHLDLDALEPTEFHAISFPTPHGLSVQQVAETIATLRQQMSVVGMSITEYASDTGDDLDVLAPILAQAAAIAQVS